MFFPSGYYHFRGKSTPSLYVLQCLKLIYTVRSVENKISTKHFSSLPYTFKQRDGTYLGLKIPHNALLKWRELKQVIDNISYLELFQVTASNLFSTAKCFLFATAILFIFSKLPLLNPQAQMSRILLTRFLY